MNRLAGARLAHDQNSPHGERVSQRAQGSAPEADRDLAALDQLTAEGHTVADLFDLADDEADIGREVRR